MVSRCRQHRWRHSKSPPLCIRGGASHPAMQRVNGLLCECMSRAALATIDGAAHFMIATHAGEVCRLIGEHVDGVESRSIPAHLDFCDRDRPEEIMAPTQKIRPAFPSRPSRQVYSFAQSPTIRARAIFPIYAKTTAALVKEALSPRSDENP